MRRSALLVRGQGAADPLMRNGERTERLAQVGQVCRGTGVTVRHQMDRCLRRDAVSGRDDRPNGDVVISDRDPVRLWCSTYQHCPRLHLPRYLADVNQTDR